MPRRSSGEGSIVHRQDGRWQASLQVEGHRRAVYGRTRSEAAAKLEDLRRQAVQAGTLPDPGRRTVGDLLDTWLDTVAPTLKPRTLADHAYTCATYLVPALGSVPLTKLTPQRIQHLLNRLQAEGLDRTAQLTYRRLSQALDLAVRWGWLAANPCARVDPPRHQAERKTLWTYEELRRFLAGTAKHWAHALWLFLIASGCRLGEALALEWGDIDLASGTVSITKTAQRLAGERVVSGPKTSSGTRHISLPMSATKSLRDHRAAQAKNRLHLGIAWQAGDCVFTSSAGNPLAHGTVEHLLQQECDRLLLPRLTPHALRHLSASLLLAEGLPVPDVARRLGHATPAVTMAIYAHARGNDNAAAEAIGKAMEG